MIECKYCLINETIEKVNFNEDNVCNFCREFKRYRYFFDESRKYSNYILKKISRKIRSETKGEKYNCLIGVSGGIDSSYLVYLA